MKRSYSKEDMTAVLQLEKLAKKKYEKKIKLQWWEKFWLHESWSLMLPLKILLPWDSPVFAPYPVHSLFKLESRLQDIQSSPKCAVAIQWIFSEISFTLKSNFFAERCINGITSRTSIKFRLSPIYSFISHLMQPNLKFLNYLSINIYRRIFSPMSDCIKYE